MELANQPIGVLTTESGLVSPELLREVGERAATLVEVVRLRLELGQALREVESSRTRLVEIGYEERRRLERDLHDGAQQRLVSLGMAIAARPAAPGRRHRRRRRPARPVRRRARHRGRRAAPDRARAAAEQPRRRPAGRAVPPGARPAPHGRAGRRRRSRCPTTWPPRPTSSPARRSPTRSSTPRRHRIELQVVRRVDGQRLVRVTDDGRGGATLGPGVRARRPGRRARRLLHGGQPAGQAPSRGGGAAVRIVIGEDSALFREGLARLLEDAGHEVVGRGGRRHRR